ncbi:MAG: hypothetical protein ACLSGS_05095 [Adlercreutzia sp.]
MPSPSASGHRCPWISDSTPRTSPALSPMLTCWPPGIIATADAEAIAGLQGILADITSGALTFDVMESEDIHMAIEAELTAAWGCRGAAATGRSRNDQVATGTRLYAKRRAGDL